jgi:TRAP-type uncharacterized transport system fused permease subunit
MESDLKGGKNRSWPPEEEGNGLEKARRLAEQEDGIGRKPGGWQRYVVPTVAIAWCFFQISIASWWILDTVFIRAIHLAFALLIVFLNYPMFRETRLGLRYLSAKDRITLLDFAVALVAAFSALYIMIDYGGITMRYGLPVARDVAIGLIMVVLLLEASRRVIGPALPVVAVCFCIYAFFGPYMPDVAGV